MIRCVKDRLDRLSPLTPHRRSIEDTSNSQVKLVAEPLGSYCILRLGIHLVNYLSRVLTSTPT